MCRMYREQIAYGIIAEAILININVTVYDNFFSVKNIG